MCSTAGKQDSAVAEPVDAPTGELVDRQPFEFEWDLLAEHRLYAKRDPFRQALQLGIGVASKLEIDAPDVVCLPVQEQDADGAPLLRLAVESLARFGNR